MMPSNDNFSCEAVVKLDGATIAVPGERRSFEAIRAYLESIALRQQRLVCWLCVDGEQVNLTQPRIGREPFACVEAETMALSDVPLQLIKAALHQTETVRERILRAVERVLINDTRRARELWWALSTALKEPLLTLSLLPETLCGPENGRATLAQLRRWQLEQLGWVIADVDEAAHSNDPAVLSGALETRVLPWLDSLQASLQLWMQAASPALSQAAGQYV
jgi:hypothetical protein